MTATTVVAAIATTLAGTVVYCNCPITANTSTRHPPTPTTLLAAERKRTHVGQTPTTGPHTNTTAPLPPIVPHCHHTHTPPPPAVYSPSPLPPSPSPARSSSTAEGAHGKAPSPPPLWEGWTICKHVPRAASEGLALFSHVWVTFVFDRNTTVHKASVVERTFTAKVRPPLLGGKNFRLFATRSPHRPNPVGLTLCRLDRVDMQEGRLYLPGIDLCDGTAVLDIKAYVCHDRPEATTLKHAAWSPSRDLASSKRSVSTPGVGAIEGVAAAVAPDFPAQSSAPGRGDHSAMCVGSVAVGHSWVEPETGRGRDRVV